MHLSCLCKLKMTMELRKSKSANQTEAVLIKEFFNTIVQLRLKVPFLA